MIPTLILFSDVNVDVLLDGPSELVFNEVAVQKSINTLFTTPLSSRPFRRRFGTTVQNMLMEPIDQTTATQLGVILRNGIETWEPRISNVAVQVLPDIANACYFVDVLYTIPSLNGKMLSYSFNIAK